MKPFQYGFNDQVKAKKTPSCAQAKEDKLAAPLNAINLI